MDIKWLHSRGVVYLEDLYLQADQYNQLVRADLLVLVLQQDQESQEIQYSQQLLWNPSIHHDLSVQLLLYLLVALLDL